MKAIIDYLRKISGGKLTQKQVDATDKLMNVATAYDVADMLGIAIDSEMTISSIGIQLITSFEDLKLKAYDDGVGVWTIGYGTTIYPNSVAVKKGDSCTLEQAKSFFNMI
jgi:lysozyme